MIIFQNCNIYIQYKLWTLITIIINKSLTWNRNVRFVTTYSASNDSLNLPIVISACQGRLGIKLVCAGCLCDLSSDRFPYLGGYYICFVLKNNLSFNKLIYSLSEVYMNYSINILDWITRVSMMCLFWQYRHMKADGQEFWWVSHIYPLSKNYYYNYYCHFEWKLLK